MQLGSTSHLFFYGADYKIDMLLAGNQIKIIRGNDQYRALIDIGNPGLVETV